MLMPKNKRNNNRMRNILTLLLMIFSEACILAVPSVKLSVSSERGGGIGVGDRFYITYQVSNIEDAPEKPASVPGAKIMYFDRTGQSSSFSNVNGTTSRSFTYIYTLTLRAETEGKYTFGPITLDGVKSNTISYNIGATSNTPQPQTQGNASNPYDNNADSGKPKFIGKGDGNLFLRATVSNSSAYEKEAIVYTVKLYTTFDRIKFIGATAAPKFEGFVVEESKDISTSLDYENYNGKQYATAVIARYIIFPQMQGNLKVIGNTYTVSVDEREYYHDPFWGNMSVAKPLQLNVTPNDLVVNVKGLPQPVPADFSGGVGQFNITSSLPAQNIKSNQAASIVYTVSGTGNLKYITLPDLNNIYPKELEVYTPNTEINANVTGSNVSGNVKFDYSFVAQEAGTFKIPEVALTYFNPSTGQYVTTKAQGYTINVDKGEGSTKSQTKSKRTFNPELLPVISNLTPIHTPYVTKFPYWLFYIVPIALIIFASIYYRAYLKANSDLMAVRSRKASKLAAKRLKKAAAAMKTGNRELFYDEMLAAIWGYLSDRLGIPTSELSRDNVSGKLAMHDIDDDKINQLIALIDDCEFEKYAPSSVAADMTAVYDKGADVINNFEDAFKKSKSQSYA